LHEVGLQDAPFGGGASGCWEFAPATRAEVERLKCENRMLTSELAGKSCVQCGGKIDAEKKRCLECDEQEAAIDKELDYLKAEVERLKCDQDAYQAALNTVANYKAEVERLTKTVDSYRLGLKGDDDIRRAAMEELILAFVDHVGAMQSFQIVAAIRAKANEEKGGAK
jgi:hypothetical protein